MIFGRRSLVVVFSVVICLALVGMGLGFSPWNKDINLSEMQESRIKESGNVDSIDVNVEPIECDDVNCWATVYQKGVINSKWIGSKNYCSEYSECKKDDLGRIENSSCEVECLEYLDYSVEELRGLVGEYVEYRLGSWADSEARRELSGVEVRSDVGSISVKS